MTDLQSLNPCCSWRDIEIYSRGSLKLEYWNFFQQFQNWEVTQNGVSHWCFCIGVQDPTRRSPKPKILSSCGLFEGSAAKQGDSVQGWGKTRPWLLSCFSFHIDLDCSVISSSPGYSAWRFHAVRHPPQGLSSQQTSLNLQFTSVPAAFLKETSALLLPKCNTKPSSSLSYRVLFLLFSIPAFSSCFQCSMWIPVNGTDISGLPLTAKSCFIEPLGLKPLQGTSPLN